jgi:membrane-anchored protein YejM (alkaline phosphatase superfamily)
MGALEHRKRLDRTIVVVVGDHGEYFVCRSSCESRIRFHDVWANSFASPI